MPVTVSYPGLYIEELPSSAHTITAAPTSITAFVGYTHPFKTRPQNWGSAVRLFSFTEYEREFGGLFASGVFDNNLAYAVNQFFLNGGADAYVIPVQPRYYNAAGAAVNDADGTDPFFPTLPTGRPRAELGAPGTPNVVFRGLEPTDLIPMTVTINNLVEGSIAGNVDTFDVTVAYGSRTETFRRVTTNAADMANFINNRINGLSSLVTVSAGQAGGYVLPIAPLSQVNQPVPVTRALPAAVASAFNAADFAPVFQQDSALDKEPVFNLMAIPGVADNGIWSQALAFCERKMAFLVLDPPEQAAADGSGTPPLPLVTTLMDQVVPKSPNGALYFPYLRSLDPITGNVIELPPSGYVTGIYSRTDTDRGVWKAPAGLETTVLNTTGVVARGRMTDMRAGVLNNKGVNALRDFPGVGTVIFGSRTLVSENVSFRQWRYVPVRRMALFIEQTLLQNLGWAVFEPNDNPLWVALRTTVEEFMLSLFRQGAFQGATPSQAFQVKCDSTTTTQFDIDNGIVNLIVAFRPLKPAEFVVIKIAQLAGQVQA